MKKIIIDIFRYIFITFSIISIVSCNGKGEYDKYLYPIRENGLYGFIDSVGNKIIDPKYLWVSTFHDGLAVAVVDTVYRIVPDSMAYQVGERDTVLNIYRMYTKYGYINKIGKYVVAPELVSYINMPKIGYVVADMGECSNALNRHTFRNERALFSDTTTWKEGYIDTKGNIMIEPRYFYSEPFSDGLAVVRDTVSDPLYINGACITPSKLRCAYIDINGNTVTDFKYENLTRFCSGRGVGTYKKVYSERTELTDTFVITESYREPRFLLNKEGVEIRELDFSHIYFGFSTDGICVTKNDFLWKIRRERLYSFVDKDGDFLEPLKGLSENQLDSLGGCDDIMFVLPENANISFSTIFHDGFAGISPDKKHWYVIDRYLIIHGYGEESVFENYRPFNYGLAAVKRNGKWGYINKKIKEQIPCKYDSCGTVYPYLEEIYEYDIQGNVKKVAYINRKDSLVWESNILKYEEINNNYSNKEKVDWGMWTYKYNPFFENIQILIYVALGILFFIVIIVWRLICRRKSGKQSIIPIDEQSVQMQANINNSTFTNISSENIIEDDDIRFYPSVGQYTETIKLATSSPEDYFKELSSLHPVLDANGDPIMSNGNFAVVYKMVDDHGKFHAIRCFHRYQEGRSNSYKLICEELDKVSTPYLLPIKYHEKEFYVDSVEYPVILMDWVDGDPLDKYIRKILNDKRKLRSLAENFRQLAIWLLNQPFAHGDLKPDNILVKEDGSLVLVDYDGFFVPTMQGQKARELGSPDFRNPSRTENDFDENIDNFSLVSILLSLELIASEGKYFERFAKEDGLLFSHDDYLNLRGSGIFRRALTSYDDDIPELAVMLERMVNGEQCDCDIVKKLLLTNNCHERLLPNRKIEKKISWFVGGCFIFVLFFPLYLRSLICWHIVMLYLTLLSLVVLMFLVLAFVDMSRPNKKEHIDTLGNGGPAGFFWWINLIPLLFMSHFFTEWFNSIVPFLSQPYYKGEWYITVLMWIIWWYSGMAIISIPEYLLKWRLKYFKTKEETVSEQTEHELSLIRAEVAKEDKQWEDKTKRISYTNNDDLPF